jgi:hypothetical protein
MKTTNEYVPPVIHVATVHMQNGLLPWAQVQLAYLDRFITEAFRLYGFFEREEPAVRDRYHYCSTEPIRQHAVKLNLLGDIICATSRNDEDWLIFIDGDAFPVGNLVPYLRESLAVHPLVAVKRLENNGDQQPHPCFCATTVGFWKQVKGNWSKGYSWTNADGNRVSDVGGELLGKLNELAIDWKAMLRSNRNDWHPLLFGVYDDMIYHHGSGFRLPVLRVDLSSSADSAKRTRYTRMVDRFFPPQIDRGFYHRMRWLLLPSARRQRRTVKDNIKLSEKVALMIENDPNFYKAFLNGNKE